MVTAVASVDQTYGVVSVLVDWGSPSATGMPGILTNLVRVTPDGQRLTVRNSPAWSSGGQVVFTDTEMPLTTSVFYIATSSSVTGTAQTGSVIVSGTGLVAGQTEIGWLRDPIQPSNDVPLSFYMHQTSECATGTGVALTDFDPVTFLNYSSNFPIIDSPYSVTVSMTRGGGKTKLLFTTLKIADILLLRRIFAPGRILLLQAPTAYGWGLDYYGNEYIQVNDVEVGRPALQDYHHQQRLWTLDVEYRLAPSSLATGLIGSNGVGAGRSTWGAMKASGLTWGQLKATGKTNAQLALGQGY